MPLKFLNVLVEKISWTDLVKWNIHAAKRRKANWIRHVSHSNFLLKHVIDGKTRKKT